MLFAILVFISAFLIESIGSYISIVGLSALFSTNPVIITLALSLDIAKVITVSFLYKQWKNIPRAMKYYMTTAAVILMIITSSGAAGYLSAEFQKAILPTKGSEIVVNAMTEEKARLEARKIEIDKQIAQLPPENVKGRQRLQKQFSGELEHINSRIVEIDKELPKLQLEQVDINAHAGPILYIAEAFDTTVESAVKYVILLIIFVFDPLAVALIIAGNFLLDQRKRELQDQKERDKQISDKLNEIKKDVEQIEEEIHHIEEIEEELIEKIVEENNVMVSEEPIDVKIIDELVQTVDEKVKEAPIPDIPAKKKRGRKKKDESEPKPSITTDEQLSEVVHGDSLVPIIEVLEEVSKEAEEVNPIHLSDLNKINHVNADVSFNAHEVEDGSWRPSKKVLNIYNKID